MGLDKKLKVTAWFLYELVNYNSIAWSNKYQTWGPLTVVLNFIKIFVSSKGNAFVVLIDGCALYWLHYDVRVLRALSCSWTSDLDS